MTLKLGKLVSVSVIANNVENFRMVAIFMIELDGVNLLGRDISPCPDSDVDNTILAQGQSFQLPW